MAKESYTSGKVADLLGIPARTARHYLSTGRIPAAQNPITGTWTIVREDLIAFMHEHKLDTSVLNHPSTVLVVDDEPAVVKFITRALEKSPYRFKIDSTNSGYEAMIKIGQTIPDLICLDIQMPGMDGPEVLRAIKKTEGTEDIKVLVITGYPEAIDEMKELGANDALTKPLNPVDLIEKVLELLPNTATIEETPAE